MEKATNSTTETKIPFLRKITPYDKEGKPGQLQLILGNGTVIVCALDQISPANQTRAMWHGLSQKLGDAVSGLSKDKLYDLAEKDIRAVVAQLATEDWDRKAIGGKRIDGHEVMHDLATVIAKLKKAVFDGVFEVVKNATQEQRDEWRKNPNVKAELADMLAKRAKAAAQGDGGELDFPM